MLPSKTVQFDDIAFDVSTEKQEWWKQDFTVNGIMQYDSYYGRRMTGYT